MNDDGDAFSNQISAAAEQAAAEQEEAKNDDGEGKWCGWQLGWLWQFEARCHPGNYSTHPIR